MHFGDFLGSLFTPNVYSLAAVSAFIFSFYHSLNTRGEMLNVPRWHLLLHPTRYLSSWKISFLYLCNLLLWATTTVLIILLFVFSQDGIYEINNNGNYYDDVLSIFISFGFFNYFVHHARSLIIEPKPNKGTSTAIESIFDCIGVIFSSKLQNKGIALLEFFRALKFLALSSTFTLLPSLILRPVYKPLYHRANYFYDMTTMIIINGRYNEKENVISWEEINHFFINHSFSPTTRKKIRRELKNTDDIEKKKQIIIGNKVKRVGYNSAKFSLDLWRNNYTNNNTKEKRIEKRIPVPDNKTIKVSITEVNKKPLRIKNITKQKAGFAVICENNQDIYKDNLKEKKIYECTFLNSAPKNKIPCKLAYIKNINQDVVLGFSIEGKKPKFWDSIH